MNGLLKSNNKIIQKIVIIYCLILSFGLFFSLHYKHSTNLSIYQYFKNNLIEQKDKEFHILKTNKIKQNLKTDLLKNKQLFPIYNKNIIPMAHSLDFESFVNLFKTTKNNLFLLIHNKSNYLEKNLTLGGLLGSYTYLDKIYIYPNDDKYISKFLTDDEIQKLIILHELTHLKTLQDKKIDILTKNYTSYNKTSIYEVISDIMAVYILSEIKNIPYHHIAQELYNFRNKKQFNKHNLLIITFFPQKKQSFEQIYNKIIQHSLHK